jgi:hypothetical protein
MTDDDLTAKDLSRISGVNDQTIRKLLRESKGSNAIRDRIAKSLGYSSFADLFLLGSKNGKRDNPERETDILKRLADLESKHDSDFRQLRNLIDALTMLILKKPNDGDG